MGYALFLAAVASLAPLIAGCRGSSSDINAAAHAANAVRIEVAKVAPSRVPQWTEAPGTVSAQYQTTVSTRIAERVDAVMVREGDRVRAGQLLVRLDTRDVDAALSQATANMAAVGDAYQSATDSTRMTIATTAAQVAAATAQATEAKDALDAAVARKKLVDAGPRPQERAQADQEVAHADAALTLSKKTYARMLQLYNGDAISPQQLDSAKSDLDSAQANYRSAVQARSMSREGSRPEDKLVADAEVSQAQAALEQARAGLAQARAGRMQVQVQRAGMQQAAAQMAQAHAGLDVAENNETYATISAPFAGIVTARLVDPGVMAGSGVPLLRMEGGALRLNAAAPESLAAGLNVGDHIPVILDSLGAKPISAVIQSVSPEADPASHTVIVKILLPSAAGVRSGLYGRARIRTGTIVAYMVPASAVIDRQGLDYVYTVQSGRANLRFVTTGDKIDGRVEILSGLDSGDEIAISNVDRLTDNGPVTESEDRL
jgi:RND family efflux transporter MFP subunit